MAETRPTLLARPAFAFLVLLALAIVLRCSTYGDPNLHGDEVFYHTVGIAMHHGAIPYVDVWDRKPFGLFALYYLITGLSFAPVAYQLAATLFAAATAATITAIARRWSGAQGALLAGAIYLLWLAPMQCFGGQSPVFYNLFIALAGLLVVRSLPALRTGVVPHEMALAMALAGLGVSLKTTAVFEGAALALFALVVLYRSGRRLPSLGGVAGLWALAGAAPSLAIAGAYAANGHWAEFWHAMVTANLDKPIDPRTSLLRLGVMAMLLSPAILLALYGLRQGLSGYRSFVAMWLLAAVIGLCAVPNFYLHYGTPLMVPLCLAGAGALDRGSLGRLAAAAIALLSILFVNPFDFSHAARSRQAMAQLLHDVGAHSGGRGLLTYEGPSQLFHLSGQPFPTPLVFPTHLSALIEKDTSHLSTLAEMQRALAARPGVIVMADPIRNGPVNLETYALVTAYTQAHCRLVARRTVLEWQQDITLAVWGDCGAPKAAASAPPR